jgi:hypothetical protein
MAIVFACTEWRPYLQGSPHKIIVWSDHKNLTRFLTTKELNGRMVRWYEKLSGFDLEIRHCKGTENSRADALSRYPHNDGSKDNNFPILKDAGDGSLRIAAITMDTWNKELQDRIVEVTKDVAPDVIQERQGDAHYDTSRADVRVIKFRGKRWVPLALR